MYDMILYDTDAAINCWMFISQIYTYLKFSIFNETKAVIQYIKITIKHLFKLNITKPTQHHIIP